MKTGNQQIDSRIKEHIKSTEKIINGKISTKKDKISALKKLKSNLDLERQRFFHVIDGNYGGTQLELSRQVLDPFVLGFKYHKSYRPSYGLKLFDKSGKPLEEKSPLNINIKDPVAKKLTLIFIADGIENVINGTFYSKGGYPEISLRIGGLLQKIQERYMEEGEYHDLLGNSPISLIKRRCCDAIPESFDRTLAAKGHKKFYENKLERNKKFKPKGTTFDNYTSTIRPKELKKMRTYFVERFSQD